MNQLGLPQRLQSLEKRIRELEEAADPGERGRVRELVQTVLDFHEAGLTRLLDLIAHAGEPGQQILHDASQDELVRSLLLLHGLHAQDLETRVAGALDRVRPFLHSQGADVELIAVADDAVQLRLQQNEEGYPATLLTLRAAIEEAICAVAPDVRQVDFVQTPPVRVPLPMRTNPHGER